MSDYNSLMQGRADLKTQYLPTLDCEKARENIDQLKLYISTFKGSGASSGYISAYEERLRECEAYFRFGKCGEYFAKKQDTFLTNIIDTAGAEAKTKIQGDTKKENAKALLIGGGVMVIAITIIIFKFKK